MRSLGFTLDQVQKLLWSFIYRLISPFQFSILGKNCSFEGFVTFKSKNTNIKIGHKVYFSKNIEILSLENASLEIMDNVFLGRGVMVSCHNKIVIGKDSLIAEDVKIHDNDHVFTDLSKPYTQQGFSTEKIDIGENCWIGANVVITKGVSIGNNTVVASGAVVTKKFGSNLLIGGVPAKIIRSLK